jgi:predicted  nucleic acid-binding Zn-ribbon protein
MELVAWGRSEELASQLTSLSEHFKNGRVKEANAVVMKIRKQGDQFQEALDGVKDGLNEMVTQKQKELETTQRKKGELEDEKKSLKREVETVEAAIESGREDVCRYRGLANQADREHREAVADYNEAVSQANTVEWYHYVPFVGLGIAIAEHIDIKARMEAAQREMREAEFDKDRAETSLNEANARKGREEEKLKQVKRFLQETKCTIDSLHRECSELKEAGTLTFELSKVLKEIRVVADVAQGKTDRLQDVIRRFEESPREKLLSCRGTKRALTTHQERWMEVREMIQGIRGRNELMLEGAAHGYSGM